MDVHKTGSATVTAASCSDSDVQAAINAAQDADTVAVPKGTCTWTATVSVATQMGPTPPAFNTKALTIRGAV